MTLEQVFAVFPPSVGALKLWYIRASTYTYKTTLKLSQVEQWIDNVLNNN